MRLSISKTTLERIERIAKISRRDPSQVVESALVLWEEAILTLLPPEKRSAYFDAALGYQSDGAVTTFEIAKTKPERKPSDPYVEYTDHASYDAVTF